jgi:DNA polymerase III delta prime subunit
MANDKALNLIRLAYDGGHLSHAYLIAGGSDNSRLEFMTDAAAILLGDDEITKKKIADSNHEDLLTVKKDPDLTTINAEQIEELSAQMRNKPYSADRIVAVIQDGDYLSENSQNKFLKLLEEPNAGNVIFILIDNMDKLLTTTISRCMTIHLAPEYEAPKESILEDAKALVSMAVLRDTPSPLMFAITDSYLGEDGKGAPTELLYAIEYFLRDMIVGSRNVELIFDERNIQIAAKIKERDERKFRKAISVVEASRNNIARGWNAKHCMRDMLLSMRIDVNLS